MAFKFKKTKMMSLRIDPQLQAAFKAACAARGLYMSDVIEQFIHGFLKGGKDENHQSKRTA